MQPFQCVAKLAIGSCKKGSADHNNRLERLTLGIGQQSWSIITHGRSLVLLFVIISSTLFLMEWTMIPRLTSDRVRTLQSMIDACGHTNGDSAKNSSRVPRNYILLDKIDYITAVNWIEVEALHTSRLYIQLIYGKRQTMVSAKLELYCVPLENLN